MTIKNNQLTAQEFRDLWQSVWGEPPTEEQVDLALKNTTFTVSIYENDQPIAMARTIGDKGLCYYIKDVIVRPEYQGKGLGKQLINEIKNYINENGIKGTRVFVELAAMPDKMPFYEKQGFDTNEAQRLKMMYEIT